MGQTKTFTFNVKAPANSGTYNFQWQMLKENVEWFGEKTPNIAVSVVLAADTTPPAAPSGLSVS